MMHLHELNQPLNLNNISHIHAPRNGSCRTCKKSSNQMQSMAMRMPDAATSCHHHHHHHMQALTASKQAIYNA